ncbi:glycosyltransferase [Sphingomonas sp. BIUV-7]|uniref:Glycosyltransferase n=1 Tax=Sphingomonas natans TaxID=3063330 RepID=A0ABT8YCW4_9SPHN|nr:glycosyltransferase family 2 protein [Sphingomonas sp. BIUV-7]MDO6416164.1 glycosyltransferase [Sphingomonas sp. BIUV-7]
MRIFVAIPTIGRPETVRRAVDHLASQTRSPDGIVVVSVRHEDVADLAQSPMQPEILFTDKGLCLQRNHALRHIADRADVVLFIDDDFLAADDYLAELERLFVSQADVVGATGRVIADGIHHAGYSFTDALELLRKDSPPSERREYPERALYGCNMAIRLSALGDLRFDEALPLYGWLEDIDVTFQLGRHGRLVRSNKLSGVHMGAKGGRTSGVRLGYSQIANPIYLLRKRSAPPLLAYEMMLRNVVANLLRSMSPEAHVDRRGRLRGNFLAMAHLATARLDPRYILRIKS